MLKVLAAIVAVVLVGAILAAVIGDALWAKPSSRRRYPGDRRMNKYR